MTEIDYEDHWYRYWESTYESTPLRIERAARDPLGQWIPVNLADLVGDDVDMDPAVVRDHPDEVFDGARAAFGAFVEDEDLDRPVGGDVGYDHLPIHLKGVANSTDPPFGLDSPYDDANTITHVTNARTTEAPRKRTKAALLTYRCPAGHETTLRQPLHRSFTLDTCGDPDCSNEVVLDDARTRARQVVDFTVEMGGGGLKCVATGMYADRTEDARRLIDADRLHLTGISRLVADSSGSVKPVYEVLDAEVR